MAKMVCGRLKPNFKPRKRVPEGELLPGFPYNSFQASVFDNDDLEEFCLFLPASDEQNSVDLIVFDDDSMDTAEKKSVCASATSSSNEKPEDTVLEDDAMDTVEKEDEEISTGATSSSIEKPEEAVLELEDDIMDTAEKEDKEISTGAACSSIEKPEDTVQEDDVMDTAEKEDEKCLSPTPPSIEEPVEKVLEDASIVVADENNVQNSSSDGAACENGSGAEVDITSISIDKIQCNPSAEDVLFELSCVICWEFPGNPSQIKSCSDGHIVCEVCLKKYKPARCPAKLKIDDEDTENVPCNEELDKISEAVLATPYCKFFFKKALFQCGAKPLGCDVKLVGDKIVEHEKMECPFRFVRYCGFKEVGCEASFSSITQHIIHLASDHETPIIERGEGHFLVRYDRNNEGTDSSSAKPLIRAILLRKRVTPFLLMAEDKGSAEEERFTRLWISSAVPTRKTARLYARILICLQGPNYKVEKVLLETELALVPSLSDSVNLEKAEPYQGREFFVDIPNSELDTICVHDNGKKYFRMFMFFTKNKNITSNEEAEDGILAASEMLEQEDIDEDQLMEDNGMAAGPEKLNLSDDEDFVNFQLGEKEEAFYDQMSLEELEAKLQELWNELESLNAEPPRKNVDGSKRKDEGNAEKRKKKMRLMALSDALQHKALFKRRLRF